MRDFVFPWPEALKTLYKFITVTDDFAIKQVECQDAKAQAAS